MRTTGSRIGTALACALVIAALMGWTAPMQAAAGDAKYHTYQEMAAALKAAAAAHPDLAKVVSIGKTREGRDLWAIEIASGAGAPPASRPALLIAANFEGDHLIGSALALATAEYPLANYPGDAAVKQRLDTSVIYIIPRMNPDGAEQMFAPVKALRRTNATPFDADNDARLDEDGPEDVNNDGVITVMRVKDPKGPYMVSPDDARLMKRADPAKGESGGWALYTEGLDNDGDGFINEDGPGGADINRNFMHAYPYYAADAGRYMVSEAETRALLDYVIAHRNIAAILTFGESDNLITAGRTPNSVITLIEYADRSVADARRVGMFADMGGGGRGGRGGGGGVMIDEATILAMMGRGGAAQPAGRAGGGRAGMTAATTVNPADTEYFNTIAAKYRELTGLRSAGYTRTPAGAFYEYGYYQFGVPSFSTPGWGLPGGGGRASGPGGGAPAAGGAPAGMPAGVPGMGGAGAAAALGQRGAGGRGASGGAGDDAESIDLRLLQWMDAEKVDGFAPWTAFKHPTLGDVEIGGFKPYTTVNPPVAKIADLGASHAKFAVYLSSLFSRVRIAKAEATALGGGLYRVRADVENAGYLPVAMAQGVLARSVKPVMVQLGVPQDSIVTGAEKTISIPALAGSGTRQSFEWIVKAKPGGAVTLTVRSQKSGADTATLTLK